MKTRFSAKAIAAAVVILAVVGLLTWHLTRPRLTDEQQLTLLIVKGQQAAESHNPAGLTKLISRNYHDRFGIDKAQMNAQIFGWLQGGPPMKVVPQIASVSIQGNLADMKLNVRYWAGEPNSQGNEFGMQLRWQKERGGWKIISAEGWEHEQEKAMGGE